MRVNNKTEPVLLDIDMASILEAIPGYVYWKNLVSVYMGCNRDFLKVALVNSVKDVVGKTDHALPWGIANPEMAVRFINEDNYILTTGESIITEDSLPIKNAQGLNIAIRTEKKPLRNKNGIIIGVIGIAIDISDQKEAEKLEIDTRLILDLTPGYIYWKDVHSIYLGFNQNFETLIAPKKIADIIGLSDYEMPWGLIKPETAAHNVEADQYVINTGEIIVTEEDIGIKNSNGRSIIVRSEKRPLKNKKGNIVGVLGVSVDITDQKEAERLRLESERQQIILKEKENFAMLAHKVVHDVNSPLTVLALMLNDCEELSEDKRTVLQRSANNACKIVQNLASHYKKGEDSDVWEVEARQNLLIAECLNEVFNEKKYQYTNHRFDFEFEITKAAKTAHIDAQPSQFRRALSNLLNNAIDALPETRHGIITLILDATEKSVDISIGDNGLGMSREMLEKIQNRICFTANKHYGHGLGLQQVWDMLEYNRGKMIVESTVDQGTLIRLTFPRSIPATWIIQEIVLRPDAILLILDDETLIQKTWELRLSPLLRRNRSPLQVKYFGDGGSVLAFIQTLTVEERTRLVLLADYELRYQEQNGLQIIIESQISKAILITGHTSNAQLRKEALDLGIGLLSKQLLADVPVRVEGNTELF